MPGEGWGKWDILIFLKYRAEHVTDSLAQKLSMVSHSSPHHSPYLRTQVFPNLALPPSLASLTITSSGPRFHSAIMNRSYYLLPPCLYMLYTLAKMSFPFHLVKFCLSSKLQLSIPLIQQVKYLISHILDASSLCPTAPWSYHNHSMSLGSRFTHLSPYHTLGFLKAQGCAFQHSVNAGHMQCLQFMLSK